jgi:hypothetical protein
MGRVLFHGVTVESAILRSLRTAPAPSSFSMRGSLNWGLLLNRVENGRFCERELGSTTQAPTKNVSR